MAAMNPLIQNLEQRDQLSDEERRVLMSAMGPEREVGTGEDIVREGDRPWQSIVLVEGLAARYNIQADGNRQVSALHVPGDFVDLHSFVLKTMDHSVAALVPSTIATVSHDKLFEISINHPHLVRLLWLSTASDGAIHQWLVQLGVKQTYSRMAHLICETFVRLRAVGRAKDHAFSFPVTQTQFGDMLGLSNVHVNRTLMDLRRDGLIQWSAGTITLIDWERLKKAAQFDPAYLYLRPEAR
jgi:CRP-like cAMP-binding protein